MREGETHDEDENARTRQRLVLRGGRMACQSYHAVFPSGFWRMPIFTYTGER
jgi:hypothetical protein